MTTAHLKLWSLAVCLYHCLQALARKLGLYRPLCFLIGHLPQYQMETGSPSQERQVFYYCKRCGYVHKNAQ